MPTGAGSLGVLGAWFLAGAWWECQVLSRGALWCPLLAAAHCLLPASAWKGCPLLGRDAWWCPVVPATHCAIVPGSAQWCLVRMPSAQYLVSAQMLIAHYPQVPDGACCPLVPSGACWGQVVPTAWWCKLVPAVHSIVAPSAKLCLIGVSIAHWCSLMPTCLVVPTGHCTVVTSSIQCPEVPNKDAWFSVGMLVPSAH